MKFSERKLNRSLKSKEGNDKSTYLSSSSLCFPWATFAAKVGFIAIFYMCKSRNYFLYFYTQCFKLIYFLRVISD